ncbi:MAG: hypothetical protein AAGD05_12140, partial [Bacteroidota bacterium]
MKASSLLNVLSIAILLVLAIGCSKDEETPEFIDPADVEALSQVLILPDGTDRSDGTPPSPSTSINAPSVTNPLNIITSSNGSTAPL